MIDRDPARERDDLAQALKPLMGTIDYYIGPNARTAVSHESVETYRRLQLALARARGEDCPECRDTSRSRIYGRPEEAVPCSLRHEPNHLVELSDDVIALMVAKRDEHRQEDATPYEEQRSRKGHRVGPPRYEAELAEMGIE